MTVEKAEKREVIQSDETKLKGTEANSAAIKAAVEACQTALEIIDNIVSGSEAQVDVLTLPHATTPVIYNVTMPNADTEYSQALPSNVKKFLIHTRDESEFRLAFVTGKVATPTAPYFTIPASKAYYEDHINPASLTLYFASASAGKVVEIIAWS